VLPGPDCWQFAVSRKRALTTPNNAERFILDLLEYDLTVAHPFRGDEPSELAFLAKINQKDGAIRD
jgi:hypothetical protein